MSTVVSKLENVGSVQNANNPCACEGERNDSKWARNEDFTVIAIL